MMVQPSHPSGAFTEEWRAQFLELLETGLSIGKAAVLAGASRSSYHRWRRHAEEYRERLDQGEDLEQLLEEDELARDKLVFYEQKVPQAQAKRVAKAHEVIDNTLDLVAEQEMEDGRKIRVPHPEATRTAKWLVEHYEDVSTTKEIRHSGGIEQRQEEGEEFRVLVGQTPEAQELLGQAIEALALAQTEDEEAAADRGEPPTDEQ